MSDKEPKKKSKHSLVIAVLGTIALCLCGTIFMNNLSDVVEDTGFADLNKPVDQLPDAPPFSKISENVDSMTDAQWEDWVASEVRNTAVTDWEGTVTQVDKNELTNNYLVYVLMDDRIISEVTFPLDKDSALALNINDRIRFSGRLFNADNSLGLPGVRIEEATIEVLSDTPTFKKSE